MKLPRPTLTPNGLGAWWFPAWFRDWLTIRSADFFQEAAWVRHDVGYDKGSPSRKECDRLFLCAMLRDASAHYRPATAAALSLLFWACVRIGGWASYNRRLF